MKRESFKSRLGFLLVSAGCAIGIGNVWKFPYLAGQNGGGFFVLFYLLFLCIMGIPVLTMELSVGRGSRKGIVNGYKALEPAGSKWYMHGWVCIFGCFMLMMYYTTVAGWMVSYFIKFVNGTFQSLPIAESDTIFATLLSNPAEMGIMMFLVVCAGFIVCSLGLQNGLEKITKVMMSCLLVLIVILAVHSAFLPGGMEGLKFYLFPSLERANTIGWMHIISSAMNQAFFTLSLGIAAMEIFGSYMSDSHTLVNESVCICILDTFVALMSGLIIFPACFSFGVQPDSGPSLIFLTLPKVFMNMAYGRVWGSFFFLFMIFASFSTVIAVFENLISAFMENFSMSRKRASLILFVMVFVFSMPCVLGYNVWSNVHLIGNRDILDSEDFIVSNILLPLGSLVFLLFCTTKYGWGLQNYLAECNKGKGCRLSEKLKPYFQFVLPILIIFIFIQGLL